MLSQDALFKIFDYLNDKEFRNLRKTSKYLRTTVELYTDPLGDINYRMKQFFDDSEMLNELLISSGSLISGSIILQTLLHTRFEEESDLDIFVSVKSEHGVYDLICYLKKENYQRHNPIIDLTSDINDIDEIKPSEDLTYSSRFKVLNFKKKWRVQIIICCLNPADFIVENFALSCVKNWYGGSFISTSSKKKLLNYESTFDNSERELLYNIPTINFVKKYINRGFQIMLGPSFFTCGPDKLRIFKPHSFKVVKLPNGYYKFKNIE